MSEVTLKYIRHSVAGFIVWPKHIECLSHRDISNAVRFTREPVVAEGRILSAGFINFTGPKPFCYGRSESLNMDSLPEDTKALRAEWGMQLGLATQPHEHKSEHGTVTGSPL